MAILRALMIGDVVGDPGLAVLEALLPGLIREYAADFVSVNGENAAEGFGLTEAALTRILAAGADAVTSGNHIWEKREFWPTLDNETRILRPANYPAGTPGRGWTRVEKAGASWLMVNLQGRELMTPIDCPFKGFDEILRGQTDQAHRSPPATEAGGLDLTPPLIVLVDFHAESTREKEALGFYLDGRAAAVAGTHTHVQTADERILPGGTAYITDLGMTGVTGSIIGMDPKICLDRARTQVLYRMECAKPEPGGRGAAVQGIIVEIDGETGRAVSIRRIFTAEAAPVYSPPGGE
jgi:metallophosphoesterase (TIGR00282 family)